MLGTASMLIDRLEASGLGYCHWKSNWVLEESLAGATDIDLLIERRDAGVFRAILHGLGFRPAIDPGTAPFPSVEHYHALDEESGELVHVHAYYRVVTGDSLGKNYRLPLERMLLENVSRIGIVNVPSRASELVVFVLRMSLKHSSLAEIALVMRDWGSVCAEATWLTSEDVRAETLRLVRNWLPGVDVDLFEAALDALLAPAPLARRVLLGRRLRAELRPFRRHGRLKAWWIGTRTVTVAAGRRTRGTRTRLMPTSGGAVIAFVGAEASGKSTMLDVAERWLSPHFTVRRVHAGKPPTTLLTAIPNLLLPALRALLPRQRSTSVSAELAAADGRNGQGAPFPLLFGVRSLLLAHDRRSLLTRAFASSANGKIVLCDRYPSTNVGALDGAQLGVSDPSALGRGRRWLAAREARLYREIPKPDLVIRLTAPLDVTLERNRTRTKSEPDEYVLSRHERSASLEFEGAEVVKLSTDRPLEDVAREVRNAIWRAL